MTQQTKRPNLLPYLLVLLVLVGVYGFMNKPVEAEPSYAEVRELFESEQVSAFTVTDTTLRMKLREPIDGKTELKKDLFSVTLFYDDLGELIEQQKADGIIEDYDFTADHSINYVAMFAPYILAVLGIFAIWYFLSLRSAGGGGGDRMAKFGTASFKTGGDNKRPTTFSDVAGADEEKEELQEIVDFLKAPGKFIDLGARIPKGVLLVGPPGTGKTLLARAVAGEAGVQFLSISGSDFVEMYVGVGASRVRDLFKDAKEAAPSIIFIDEIDAVGRQRGTGLGGGHDEREQTLNQLLVEMDGFESNDSVVLIAATNRADILDPALLRPGRFDRQIVVDTPDVKGREKILQVHSKDKPMGSDVDLAAIAKLTPGFTGADLANLMNESALLTARKGKKIITMREVNESMERVIAGPERKGRVLDEHTKRTIAYHESGHALVGHLLEHADPVHKISIISRGRALGYTLSIPDEDKVLNSVREMRDQLAVFLGGRVAEEIFCEDITTGASNDLERATKMARAMVTQYGMSSELGAQVFGQPNHEVFLGRDYGNTQDYSEETARRIDDEVARIMKDAHDRAYEILSAHRDQMDLMASVLLERETVEGEACQALLDNRWNEYLDHEDEIIARHEREEAEARARDAQLASPDWNEQQGAGAQLPAQQQEAPLLKNNILSSGSGLLHDLENRFSQLADEQPKQGRPAQQQPQQPASAQQAQTPAPADVEVIPAQVEPVEPAQPAGGDAENAPQGKDGSDAR